MSEELKAMIARRPLLAGALAALGFAVAAGVAYETGLFGPSHPKTSYDDLLALLPDRAQAQTIGKVVLAENTAFDAKAVAAGLRARLGGKTLADVVAAEVAADKTIEVDGWLLPETLAQLCALAAKVAA